MDQPDLPDQQEGMPSTADLRMDQQQRYFRYMDERNEYRNRKVSASHGQYIKVMFLFAVLQIIGIAFFTKGFLLSRQVLPNQSTCLDQQNSQTCHQFSPFKKTVILLIDALRFDFVIPVEDQAADPYYHNNFPILYEQFANHPQNSLLLKFIADPPTTTLQRLKGLTTGSLPTFVDAGSNFDGDTIDEDNWVSQLHSFGKNVAFVGDDTWTALFSPFLHPNMTFPFPSLNVWDLHSVDNGVIEHLYPMIKDQGTEWDVLIGHFLGVDHCGHRYGPRHYAMKQKLDQMNSIIGDVIDSIDEDTLLVVFGDHGMDFTGNHGGESKDELEAALFMYSKRDYFGRLSNDHYNISNLGNDFRAVNQIDLVPTFSMMMGLPVPFNNLGSPIEEAFIGPNSKNQLELAKSNFLTCQQIHNYRQASDQLSSDEEINAMFNELSSDWDILQKKSPDQLTLIAFNAKCYEYQALSLDKCKSLWATFDNVCIIIGIGIVAISLGLLIIYTKLVPLVVITQLNSQFITSSAAMTMVHTLLTVSFTLIFKPENLSMLWSVLLGVSLGIINGILAPIIDRYSIPWLFSQVKENLIQNGWTYFALALILMHSLIFTSNSFVIWEDKIVAFWLITFGFCAVFKSFKLKDSRKRLLGVYHSVVFVLLTRLTSTIRLCREEQGSKCVSNFETTWWSVGLIYVFAFLLPKMIEKFFDISQSYQGAAQLWVSKGLRGLMLLIALMWTLEYIENSDYFNSKIQVPLETFKVTRLTIARIVMGISLIASNFGWSLGPLCIKIDLGSNQSGRQVLRTANIIGYGNVYGSAYFLFVINILCAVLLVNKPLGIVSLALLINQILTLLELIDILKIRTNLVSVVTMGLLAYLHFFSTGHQATLQAIHWDTGFIITETIVFPLTHISIILDTLGPFIIVCLCISLMCLWKIPPTSKAISLISKIVENSSTLIIYQLCLTLSTLIMTNHFRRHLMVWKIFAPRFMLNGIILIAMNVILTLVTVGFATGRVIKRWNQVFGN
ncbi:hypothetical protein OGAPHI_003630 [Ogataea philodendri]|uniref:GPI ethanolamine phosphate transferase 3 n=1 Tax=Ogataea philodendri TaxID=1378263 RepID=A0A9P8T470_9ASCO|nr:uncharacterized protein OGAPHI_003630 [Ogataea philodendri]KAH3665446.1 hypothetical protein OGAPHI_003630 [Ogataea philodendri]